MKNLTNHQTNLDDSLKIEVIDEPDNGGTCHAYDITGFDTINNKASENAGYRRSFSRVPIVFQNGPIKEVGINGISNESLLAIVEHRLEGFQSGSYSCVENAHALLNVKQALLCLHNRTLAREIRGVEGTSTI